MGRRSLYVPLSQLLPEGGSPAQLVAVTLGEVRLDASGVTLELEHPSWVGSAREIHVAAAADRCPAGHKCERHGG